MKSAVDDLENLNNENHQKSKNLEDQLADNQNDYDQKLKNIQKAI